MVRYPIPRIELERLRTAIRAPVSRPRAFVLGHGLWNNLDLDKSIAWLDTVLEVIHLPVRESKSLLDADRTIDSGPNFPILLLTPNAAGEQKPAEWIITQGNKALVLFERAMAVEAAKRHIDHLGTWNMSIQTSLYDGVHMDMRGNLVKAMMVLNWLNSL